MTTFKDLIYDFIDIIKLTFPIIISIGVVYFLYGLYGYINNAGDEGKRKESVQYMIYGIIGIFVMVAIWGLLAILTGTFGFSSAVPQVRY